MSNPRLFSKKKFVFWRQKFVRYIKIGFYAGLGFTILLFPFYSNFQLASFVRQFVLYMVLSIFIWVGNEWLVDFLDRRISWIERPRSRLFWTLITTLGYTVPLVMAFQAAYYWLVFNKDFWEFIAQFRMIDYFITIAITLVIVSFLHGRAFLYGWKESILETEKFKQAHISAQYETLKNQVNPHFLFNSFNVLSILVYKDADLAAKFIKQLAQVYRYVLDTREKEVVTLKEELKALESYIFLMKIRFGENLIIQLNISPGYEEMIVPLTLQMLLENAIKHNEISKSYPLDIQINRVENDWISMKNKFYEKQQAQHKSGIGLENIKARYKFISQKEVEIIKTEKFFEVKVPIVKLK